MVHKLFWHFSRSQHHPRLMFQPSPQAINQTILNDQFASAQWHMWFFLKERLPFDWHNERRSFDVHAVFHREPIRNAQVALLSDLRLFCGAFLPRPPGMFFFCDRIGFWEVLGRDPQIVSHVSPTFGFCKNKDDINGDCSRILRR